MIRKAWILAILLVAAVARSETSTSVVREVGVAGNQRIEADAIRTILRSKPGLPMDPVRVKEDLRRVFGLGYFIDVRIYFDPATGRLTVWVAEKTMIREIGFSGNKEIDTDDLKKDLETKPFSFLDESKIRADLENLRKQYDGKGYYLADVTTETQPVGANDVRLIFVIKEDHKVKIERINFLGNKLFDDDKLKSVIRTKEKGFLSFLTDSGSLRQEMFAVDRQLLRDFYGHQGYIKVKVGDPRVQLSPSRSSLSLTLNIEEGERYTIDGVDVDGEFIKPKEELMKALKVTPGDVADSQKIQADLIALSTIYADEGYAYANILPRDAYDEERKRVRLTYFLQPGPKVRIERIRITGNKTTRDKVLRREMQLREGDLYHGTKLRQSRENIERLALFEKVSLTTQRGSSDDKVDVVIDIAEKPTGTFSIGAGFNTLESFQVIAQVEKRNLFGYGVDVSLQARIGGQTQAFNVRYRDEYFLDSRFGLTVNGFSISRKYPDYDQTSRGGSLGLDYPLYVKALQRVRSGVTYSLIDESLSDLRSTIERLFTGGLTSSLTFSISRDTRNRVFEPSKGSYLLATEEVAGSFLGGDNSFSKSEFEGKWFFPLADESRVPLFGGSVFALRFRVGYVTPLKDGERVPIFERYAPGGIFTIRGFDIRTLGPESQIASTADPGYYYTTDFRTGGNKEIIFNSEYIFPIIRAAAFPLNGVAFFDMGNAFDNGESMFTITGQRQSAGFGVRWFSPIGPLRFEWGWPLDRKENESPVVFDFTIGSLF